MGNQFITQREAIRLTGEAFFQQWLRRDAENYLSEHPRVTPEQAEILRAALLTISDGVADILDA